MRFVLDTDILIDLLRGYTPALEWFVSLTEQPAVVSLAVMELVQGCRNRNELRTVQSLVAPLEVWYPTAEEMQSAMEIFTQQYLRNRLSIIDAIIGSVVVSRDALLYTFNMRHYQFIPNLKTAQPYTRSET